MENKQTAVEWLEDQIFASTKFIDIDLFQAIEQAKAMEKEQIIDAYAQGFIESESMDKGAEQYYNETFKPEKL